MDINQPSTTHSISACIAPANAIENLPPGVTSIQDSISGKICYTLTLPDNTLFLSLQSLSRNPIKSVFIDQLRESLLYTLNQSVKNISPEERDMIENNWKKYFVDGYSDAKLKAFVLDLRSRYGDDIIDIESKITQVRTMIAEYRTLVQKYQTDIDQRLWTIKSLSPELAIDIINTLKSGAGNVPNGAGTIIRDIVLLWSDPQYRRIAFEDALTTLIKVLEKYTGVRFGIINTGWVDRVDWASIIKLPTQVKGNSFILSWNWYTVRSSTLEEWSDTVDIMKGQPIFAKYLVSLHGDIIWEVKTPLSRWTEKFLFPTKEDLIAWIYNPSLLPQWGEIDIFVWGNGKSGILLTKITPKWWFIKVWVAEDYFLWIEAKRESLTLWYIDKKWALRWNMALTGTSAHFRRDGDPKTIENTAVGLVGNWEWKLIQSPTWTLGGRGHGDISIQVAEGWDPKNTETARGRIDTHAFLQYTFSSRFQWEVWIWNNRLWSPNFFPNTFYKLSAQERQYQHFQNWKQYHLAGSYQIPWGEVKWKISKEIWRISDTTRYELGYIMGKYTLSYDRDSIKPKHPLLSNQEMQGMALGYRNKDIWLHVGVSTTKIWDTQKNIRSNAWVSVRF